MKAYTVSNTKNAITVVANSKEKAEKFVKEDRLISLTMDGYLKVEIDKFVDNITLVYDEDGEAYEAILKTSYSDKEINVPAKIGV